MFFAGKYAIIHAKVYTLIPACMLNQRDYNCNSCIKSLHICLHQFLHKLGSKLLHLTHNALTVIMVT